MFMHFPSNYIYMRSEYNDDNHSLTKLVMTFSQNTATFFHYKFTFGMFYRSNSSSSLPLELEGFSPLLKNFLMFLFHFVRLSPKYSNFNDILIMIT